MGAKIGCSAVRFEVFTTNGVGSGHLSTRSVKAALLVSIRFISAGTIVPVPHSGHKLRGAKVSLLGHRGLAGLSSPTALGVEPGHYGGSVSNGECLR